MTTTSMTTSKSRPSLIADEDDVVGHKYIHRESSTRQQVLNECFRYSSSIALNQAAATVTTTGSEDFLSGNNKRQFNILEIGCGTGWTTRDLARMFPNAHITAIDADPSLIRVAQALLREEQEKEEKEDQSTSFQNRIEFVHKQGVEINQDWENKFDIIWTRFVLVHVQDPILILKGALGALKPGGVLLAEEPGSVGHISDPPLPANDVLHECHIQTSEMTKASVHCGPLIGEYMKQVGFENIHLDTFVPLFARQGVSPWLRSASQSSPLGPWPPEHFQLGVQFLRMTLESAAPRMVELGVTSVESIDDALKTADPACMPEHQCFSLPSGKVFQWQGTKPLKLLKSSKLT